MGWLNCLVRVPASEGPVTMQLQGRLAFLAVPEHSSGVHRGMMLPPAALQVLSLLALKFGTQVTSTIKQAFQCLHVSAQGAVEAGLAQALLLHAPLADASMPYNVICLTLAVAVVYVAALTSALFRKS